MELFPGSKRSYVSNLNIFEVPNTDISITSSSYIPISPVNSLGDNGNINFRIPPALHSYYDLSSSYLYLKARVLYKDGTSLVDKEDVAPSSLFLYTAFNNLRVTIQGITLSDTGGHYAYRAILTQLLGRTEAEKKSSMTSCLYYPDDVPDSFDTTKNLGYKKRKEIAANSKSFDLLGRPSNSLFEQERYIVPGVEIELSFTRNSPELALMSSINAKVGQSGFPFKFSIDHATLYVRSLTINSEIEKLHQKSFSSNSSALYILNDFSIKGVSIPSGTQTFSTGAVFSTRVPKYICIALLDSEAYIGNVKKSLQNFTAKNLCSIIVKDDDTNTVCNSIEFDLNSNLYQLAYQTMFGALPPLSGGNGISRDDFLNGNSVYIFDLANSGPYFKFLPERRGSIKVELKFKEALSSPLQLLICGTLTSVLSINKERNATVV